jgi:hypothetical protein
MLCSGELFFILWLRLGLYFQALLMVVAGWQEAATEVSLEVSHKEPQCEWKQQMWGGDSETSNQQGSRYFRLQTSVFLKWRFCWRMGVDLDGTHLFIERTEKTHV